jgi:hypothetical protein
MMKQACGLVSMRDIDKESTLNKDEVRENIMIYLGITHLEELPHYDTINNFLEKLDPNELEQIRFYMIRQLISKKVFEKDRLTEGKNRPNPIKKHYWTVAVDATNLHTFSNRHSEAYTSKNHTAGGTKYYAQVLEAKLVFGNIVISLASEFIDNEQAKTDKQDCELTAFKRLAKKIKKAFPKLPICLLADSLYPSQPVFEICKANGWRYLLRYKAGKIPTITQGYEFGQEEPEFQEYNEGIEKGGTTVYWRNKIEYRGFKVNVLEMYEKDSNGINQSYVFISDIKVDKYNADNLANAGRSRWKIENQGFNRQKNEIYFIEHANSWNYNAQKNHYLMAQITDIVMILFEKGDQYFKEKKKGTKEKSSQLLVALREHLLTSEDLNLLKKRKNFRLHNQ